MDALLLDGRVAKWSYQYGLHGRLSISEYKTTVDAAKRLPRALKIACLTDFHAGPTTHTAIFEKAFAAIEAAKPDLLLLGGDFVSCKARYITQLTPFLASCSPPLGKFAVFGNHDLWTNDAYLSDRLAEADVQLLTNKNVTLPPPFDNVSICGIDDPWTGEANARQAFLGAGEIRILLMHAPDGLLLLGDEKFDIAFAGHTHGGQIALSNGRPIVLPHGPLARKYHFGFFDIAGNGTLIVSRGIGCSNVPVRINADPELVICNLA